MPPRAIGWALASSIRLVHSVYQPFSRMSHPLSTRGSSSIRWWAAAVVINEKKQNKTKQNKKNLNDVSYEYGGRRTLQWGQLERDFSIFRMGAVKFRKTKTHIRSR